MKSFFRGVRDGRFQCIEDREDLWKLLVTLTAHNAVAVQRRARAGKRGKGQMRGESALAGPEDLDRQGGIASVMGREPTPAFACQDAENCHVLLERLGDQTLHSIALCKMEGYSNQEIAAKLNLALRTVERKLRLIRQRWTRAEP